MKKLLATILAIGLASTATAEVVTGKMFNESNDKAKEFTKFTCEVDLESEIKNGHLKYWLTRISADDWDNYIDDNKDKKDLDGWNQVKFCIIEAINNTWFGTHESDRKIYEVERETVDNDNPSWNGVQYSHSTSGSSSVTMHFDVNGEDDAVSIRFTKSAVGSNVTLLSTEDNSTDQDVDVGVIWNKIHSYVHHQFYIRGTTYSEMVDHFDANPIDLNNW